jgi:hypothetical protein
MIPSESPKGGGTAMNERLTRAEIDERFPSEWVLLSDPEQDKYQRVLNGVVLCHSKDRDVVYTKMLELRPRNYATLYTGNDVPDGVVFVL